VGGSCEYGDEPSRSGARELVTSKIMYWLLLTVTGCYCAKRSMQLGPFFDLLCLTSEF
jgi:hypothetical protein